MKVGDKMSIIKNYEGVVEEAFLKKGDIITIKKLTNVGSGQYGEPYTMCKGTYYIEFEEVPCSFYFPNNYMTFDRRKSNLELILEE